MLRRRRRRRGRQRVYVVAVCKSNDCTFTFIVWYDG
jgi:hypothetical protein